MHHAIAIIPARGGSREIPGKNLMQFCGRTLLAWTILQARASRCVTRVFVSSDSQDILQEAVRCGAEPILRPDRLALDSSTSEEALNHAMEEIESSHGLSPHVVVFLQATSPLRKPGDIDAAVEHFEKVEADSLFSMSILEDFTVWHRQDGELKGLTFDPRNRGLRQDRPPLHLENGSIYLFRPQVLARYDNRIGGRLEMYEMESWQSHEIDGPGDAELCAYYFKNKLQRAWENTLEAEN